MYQLFVKPLVIFVVGIQCLVAGAETTSLRMTAPSWDTPLYPKSGASYRAPGAPGSIGTWARPDKDGYGASYVRPVWFTLAQGSLTEVAYPHVDTLQTRDSFLAVKYQGRIYDERTGEHQIERHAGTLAYRVVTFLPIGRVIKEFYNHPDKDAVIADYKIEFYQDGDYELIFQHNPAAANTAGGDYMYAEATETNVIQLVAMQGDVRGDEPKNLATQSVQIVNWTLSGGNAVVGFEGHSAPLDQWNSVSWPQYFNVAGNGNVAGALVHRMQGRDIGFRVMLSFYESLAKSRKHAEFMNVLSESREELLSKERNLWGKYLQKLQYDRTDVLAEASILVLKGLEDKTHRGALIAAPANPALPWLVEAVEHPYEQARLRHNDANSGYRRSWPRDLYHKALAFLAVGDVETATDILRWFKKVQRSDGFFAQNMWTDGSPSWGAYQQDQVAFPVLLVERLTALGAIEYTTYRNMVRKSISYVMMRGTGTDQERWEENWGLSPNSLSVAVDALYAAAKMEETQPGGDATYGQRYRAVAQEWHQNFKSWTLIQNGHFGSGYFARMEVGHQGSWNPGHHSYITIQNKRPQDPSRFREDQILDGGFLHWILNGLFDPFDQDFQRTLDLYDRHVTKESPYGVGYLRYNEDAYGENHRGGLWPLLSAERGIVAMMRGEPYQQHLQLMQNVATPGHMMGEQDTLAVRPLGWSHGAYLVFQRSIRDQRSFYLPPVSRL